MNVKCYYCNGTDFVLIINKEGNSELVCAGSCKAAIDGERRNKVKDLDVRPRLRFLD